jgi:ubiquinol-cytochrome c reductase subunit 7
MELADPDTIKGRMRRLKRASDLSFKAKSYTDYQSVDLLDPFKEELRHDIEKIAAREEESMIMNAHKM